MALSRNLHVDLRISLCDVLEYVSAQTCDFMNFAKNHLFPHRKLPHSHSRLSGWELFSGFQTIAASW